MFLLVTTSRTTYQSRRNLPPDALPLPCPAINSFYNGARVTSCRMKCPHQQILTKASPCTDTTSFSITKSQCFAKGEASGDKCMHTSYKTAGETRSVCGPCAVTGVGNVPCYAPGNAGPEDGSVVESCSSACDIEYSEYGVPCGGATPCPPTPPPPATVEAFKLGEETGVKLEEGAPDYFAAKVPAPYDAASFEKAAKVAAKAAGWWSDAAMPPKAAVVVWGKTPAGGPVVPGEIKQMWGPGPSGVEGGVPDPGIEDGVLPRASPDSA